MEDIQERHKDLTELKQDISTINSICLSIPDDYENHYIEHVNNITTIKNSIMCLKSKYIEDNMYLPTSQKIENLKKINDDVTKLEIKIESIKNANYNNDIRKAYTIICKYTDLSDKYWLVHPCENEGYYLNKRYKHATRYKQARRIFYKYVEKMRGIYESENKQIQMFKIKYVDNHIL